MSGQLPLCRPGGFRLGWPSRAAEPANESFATVSDLTGASDRWIRGALAACVVGSALALGGATAPVVILVCLTISGLAVAATFRGYVREWPTPALLIGSLGLYTLVQSVPLPVGLVQKVSPRAADVWGRTLRPFGESVTYASLSLDPGATSIEAAKWLAYGAVFALAAAISRRRGPKWGVGLVFVSAAVIAIATMAHGLAGATRVFGVYEPQFGPSRWHIGPFLNPNNLAGYINLGVFAGFGLSLSGGHRKGKWFWALGAAFLTATSFLTGSRGGAVALVLCLILFAGVLWRASTKGEFGRLPKPRDWVGLLLAVAIGAIFFFLAARDMTWKELFQTNVEKLQLSGAVLPMLLDYPWFGIGRGAFESAFPYYLNGSHSRVYAHPENWIVQWFSEWGPVAGTLAIVGFAWLLRPSNVGAGASAVRLGAFIAVVCLLGQNLVDMGTELLATGLAAAVLLGSLWTSGPTKSRRSKRKFGVRAIGWSGVLGASMLTISSGLAWARGSQAVARERVRLHDVYTNTAEGDIRAYVELRSELREAMLRHPAEAYFPRLGALIAVRTGSKDALVWGQRSLELCETSGATHWIIAHALRQRNVLNQALMEARLAVEYEPRLAREVGVGIARWTQTPVELERAAPPGRAGAQTLEASAEALADSVPIEVRVDCYRAAIRRDGTYPGPRRALAGLLIRHLETPLCAVDDCPKEVRAHAEALDRLQPDSADGVEISTRLALETGHVAEVNGLLQQRCPALEHREKTRCYRALLRLIQHQGSDPTKLTKVFRDIAEDPCRSEDDCHRVAEEVGDALGKVGLWAEALQAYERAGRANPHPKVLLKVADAAVVLGRIPVANAALARAYARSRGDMRRQVADRRDALLRSAPP